MQSRLLLLTVLALPLLEIALFVLIGLAIGVVPTVLGVLLSGIAGALLIRWHGLSRLRELRVALERGKLPGRQIADVMLIGVAGLLLMLPGYLTDVAGLVLLVPPIRSLIYRLLAGRFRPVAGMSPANDEPGLIDLDEGAWRDR